MTELIFIKNGANILSGNAIDFELAITPYNYITQKETTFIVISIAQEIARNSGIYSEIKSQTFYPNDQGLVSLDIASIADAYLAYFTPPANLDRMIEVPHGQCRKFSVKFSMFESLSLISEVTKYITTIKAGAEYQYFNTDLSYKFKGAATEQKLLFITDNNDQVHVDDLFYIHFTVVPGIAPQILAKFTVNYMLAGVYANVSGFTNGIITVPASLSIACMPAGFNQLNLSSKIPAGAIPINYSISIFGGAAGATTIAYLPPVNFMIDQRVFYDTVQLVYRNSLGGLQPLRLRGQVDIQADYKFQNIFKMPSPSYLLDGNLQAEQEQLYNEEDQKFTGETGFITKYQADRLRDFFLSKQRFEVKDGRLIPIILNTKTVKFYTNKDNLFSVQIDWQHAFTNNFFSNTNLPPVACPSINELTWRQTSDDEISIFYSLPFGQAYARISIEFPGEPLVYYTLEGNSGIRKIVLIRPASAVGVNIALTIRGSVVCDRYNVTPGYGPEFNVGPLQLLAEQLPLAANDFYNITAGYSTAVALVGSVLDNDYDQSGATLEVIAAAGATTAGGSYTINNAGIVFYIPLSTTFIGPDTFTYQMRKSPAGIPVTATVTINVGAVAPIIYSKIVYRNGSAWQGASYGEVWIDFFSNPAGTTPIDISPFGLTMNYTMHEAITNYGVTQVFDTTSPIPGTGFGVLIFSGTLSEILDQRQYEYYCNFIIAPGTGYITI